MPFAAAPRLDHLGRDDVDQDLGEQAAFRIAFEVVGRLVPAEIRVEHQRQKQVVPVVHDDELSAGALLRRVIDQVLLRAVRADVTLQRELARDDLLDGDFLVPAVAAILLLAPRLRNLFRAAERASRFDDCLAWHMVKSSTMARPAHARRAPPSGDELPRLRGDETADGSWLGAGRYRLSGDRVFLE